MPNVELVQALARVGITVSEHPGAVRLSERWEAKGRIGRWNVTLYDSSFDDLCHQVLVHLKEASDA